MTNPPEVFTRSDHVCRTLTIAKVERKGENYSHLLETIYLHLESLCVRDKSRPSGTKRCAASARRRPLRNCGLMAGCEKRSSASATWVWVKIRPAGTAGFTPCFHLPGQASLGLPDFLPTAISAGLGLACCAISGAFWALCQQSCRVYQEGLLGQLWTHASGNKPSPLARHHAQHPHRKTPSRCQGTYPFYKPLGQMNPTGLLMFIPLSPKGEYTTRHLSVCEAMLGRRGGKSSAS